ncbi:acetylxylan esterase [Planctomycetota bacterium]|nr:acetylxylan esterase [Planctomycetota bacterium]
MIKFLACLCCLAVPLTSGLAQEEPVLPDQDHFLIFLLIGQSNMAGRGKVEDQDRQAHPRVLTLSKDDAWIPAIDPIHFDKSKAGVGLGLTFGKTVAEALPGYHIGLVPCAVGGTSLTAWIDPNGKLLSEAYRRCKLAQGKGKLAGILWHQGESGPTAAVYPAMFTSFAEQLRKDLAGGKPVPLVIGTLSDGCPVAKTMNPMLLALAPTIPATSCVDTAGLAGDLHFTNTSLRQMGQRYAAAWLTLAKPEAATK